jgi:hypothetical protein
MIARKVHNANERHEVRVGMACHSAKDEFAAAWESRKQDALNTELASCKLGIGICRRHLLAKIALPHQHRTNFPMLDFDLTRSSMRPKTKLVSRTGNRPALKRATNVMLHPRIVPWMKITLRSP